MILQWMCFFLAALSVISTKPLQSSLSILDLESKLKNDLYFNTSSVIKLGYSADHTYLVTFPIVNITLIEVDFNRSSLTPRIRNFEKETFVLISHNLIDINYFQPTVYYEKHYHEVNITGEVIFTYKSLVFTNTANDEIKLFKYSSNFLYELPLKTAFGPSLEDCKFNKILNSGKFILTLGRKLCLYEIISESSKGKEKLIIKNVITLENMFNQRELVGFCVLKNSILLALKTSLVIIDFQGQVQQSIKSFEKNKQFYSFSIKNLIFYKDVIYITMTKGEYLEFSVIYPYTLTLIYANLFNNYQFLTVADNHLYSVNSDEGDLIQKNKIHKNKMAERIFRHIIPNKEEGSYWEASHVLGFENFTVILSKKSGIIYLIDEKHLYYSPTLYGSIILEKIDSDLTSVPSSIFKVEDGSSSFLGVVCTNNKVILISNMTLGRVYFDFIFRAIGLFDMKFKVKIATPDEGLIDIPVKLSLNITRVSESDYISPYFSVAFSVILVIAAAIIMVMITYYIFTRFEKNSLRNLKAGYALTNTKEVAATIATESEVNKIDIGIDIKTN